MNQGKKSNDITNDYASDGRKLSSRHVMSIPKLHGYTKKTTTGLYIDGLIVRNGTPLLWQFDGGYVDLDANGAPTSWNYYVTDHLGSTRMVVDSKNNIKETINYYPFGSEMRMKTPAQLTNTLEHPFRFTGKELDKQNGLNMYDFGARLFDVAGVPMWTSVDPLAEKYYNVSPYVYCENNPIMLVDPDGRASGDYYNTSGKNIGTDGVEDGKKYLVLDSGEQKLVKKQGTIAQDELSSVVPVPSDKVANAMEKAFDKTEETGKEYGFRVGINGTVTTMVEGTEIDISDWSIPMEELRAKGEYAAYDVHTHPLGDSPFYGQAIPSPTDKQNVIKSSGQPSVVLGYTQKPPTINPNMIGGSTNSQFERSIGFYNSNGIICKPMSFSQFQRAVTRINR